MIPVGGIIHSRKVRMEHAKQVIEIYHVWILTQQHLLDSHWNLKIRHLVVGVPLLCPDYVLIALLVELKLESLVV